MSKSQKFIGIVSILNIIGGAIWILFGILAICGASIAGNEELVKKAGDENAPILVTLFIVMLIVSGVFSLICGILGIRAARDASKIKPVFILSVISLAVAVIGLIAGIIGGEFSVSGILDLVAPGLMLFCANNVRKQAK